MRSPPAAVWRALKRAVRLLEGRGWWLVPLTSLGLVVGGLETVLLYLLVRSALSLRGASQSLTTGKSLLPDFDLALQEVLALGAVLLIVLTALSFLAARQTSALGAWVVGRQRQRLLDAFLSSSWAYRSARREGGLHELMVGYSLRCQFLVQMALTVTTAGSAMVVIALSALVLAPIPALVSIAGLALVVLLMRPVRARLGLASARAARAQMALVSRIAETARLSAEIAAFDVGTTLSVSVAREIGQAVKCAGRVRFLTLLSPALFYSAALGLVLLVIAFSVAVPSAGSATVGLVILLLVRSLGYGRQLQTALHIGIEGLPYVEDLAAAIRAFEQHVDRTGAQRIERIDRVAFEGVGFEYEAGRPVLAEVDFVIEPGDMIGVMGPTGEGKTTLVQILVGLRRPTRGRVVVDGTDLCSIQHRSWARCVGFVPQDNQLILATVADNIRFYRAGFDAQDVEAAARSAHLHERIVALPEGYETLLGPGAQGLSGGERQRLGIARALLGRPHLLVLDEPTSALDEHSEGLVRSSLMDLRGETTIVLVAHRAGMLEACSRIFEVRQGALRELDVAELPARMPAWSRSRE